MSISIDWDWGRSVKSIMPMTKNNEVQNYRRKFFTLGKRMIVWLPKTFGGKLEGKKKLFSGLEWLNKNKGNRNRILKGIEYLKNAEGKTILARLHQRNVWQTLFQKWEDFGHFPSLHSICWCFFLKPSIRTIKELFRILGSMMMKLDMR